MKALKFDLEIPFWCSFADFGSLNIKLTYPFPPPTTIFGLIQNAMQLPALHTLNHLNSKNVKEVKKSYINSFNHLKFAIILEGNGEKIEDFVNIHKGSRQQENLESDLEKILKYFVEDLNLNKNQLKKINIAKLKLKKFHEHYKGFINVSNADKKVFNDSINSIREYSCETIFNIIETFWDTNIRGKKGFYINGKWISTSQFKLENSNKKGLKTSYQEGSLFNLNKQWVSTQIHRQRILNPKFRVYICSEENDDFWGLNNIFNVLKNPKRPLYIGESDDVVNILNLEIVELNENKHNSKIHSVLPGIYANSELVKIPIKLKYDIDHPNNHYKICSIPKGDINESIESYSHNGENIVFL